MKAVALSIILGTTGLLAQSPDGPSQQCLDDAGPPWADDGPQPYHFDTPALPVLQENQCPDPLKSACASKGTKRAYLEGPLQCGGRGWFCRIIPQSGWRNPDYTDKNFAHCNATDADERDNDGHCHGSDTDNVYGWWIRDHWHRGYAGTLHCCCDWNGLKGLVNRCDYRKYVSPFDLSTCRDANEEHNKGFEGTCQAHSSIPFNEPIGTSAQCWSVYNFADPESVPDPKPILNLPTPKPTSTPTQKPTLKPTLQPTPHPPQSSSSSGFDWGEGCPAGNGDFRMSLPIEDTYADVGTIPTGKFNIRIDLAAETDLDIALFDVADTSLYPSGSAIVAWCAGANCNKGVLGMLPGKETATYKNMTITYSGYNGINGRKGDEYIEIRGETTVEMQMRAYAYQAGTASVTYSWGVTETPCCLGLASCGGEFTQEIRKGEIVEVGKIPKGKLSVYIELVSDNDVDIQVYDLDETSQFEDGKAIIAWCVEPCNVGDLRGPSEESTMYPAGVSVAQGARKYLYSGYLGDGKNLGHEYIKIELDTTRNLMMKAYGYASGFANVKYSFFEPTFGN